MLLRRCATVHEKGNKFILKSQNGQNAKEAQVKLLPNEAADLMDVEEKNDIVGITSWKDIAKESKFDNNIEGNLMELVFKKLEVESRSGEG